MITITAKEHQEPLDNFFRDVSHPFFAFFAFFALVSGFMKTNAFLNIIVRRCSNMIILRGRGMCYSTKYHVQWRQVWKSDTVGGALWNRGQLLIIMIADFTVATVDDLLVLTKCIQL